MGKKKVTGDSDDHSQQSNDNQSQIALAEEPSPVVRGGHSEGGRMGSVLRQKNKVERGCG